MKFHPFWQNLFGFIRYLIGKLNEKLSTRCQEIGESLNYKKYLVISQSIHFSYFFSITIKTIIFFNICKIWRILLLWLLSQKFLWWLDDAELAKIKPHCDLPVFLTGSYLAEFASRSWIIIKFQQTVNIHASIRTQSMSSFLILLGHFPQRIINNRN